MEFVNASIANVKQTGGEDARIEDLQAFVNYPFGDCTNAPLKAVSSISSPAQIIFSVGTWFVLNLFLGAFCSCCPRIKLLGNYSPILVMPPDYRCV